MRQRVAQFLKVLNRAKPEPAGEKERKTARCVLLLASIVIWDAEARG